MAGMTRRALMWLAISGLLIELSMAASYTVGGPSGGWDSSTNLQTWGSSQSFSVGDTLVFKYSPTHDVSEVSKSDYDNCVASNSIQAHTDGNTAITLSSPGKRYFICGTPGHCSQGMKLEVVTLATSTSPSAAPTASPSAAPTTSPSAAPTASPSAAPTASPAPQVSAPAPAESPSFAPALSPPLPSTEAPLPSVETPSGTPIPTGLSPIPPPPSSAIKCSFSLAFGFAMIMLSAL